MRKLFALALLSAVSACATNFTFLQKTPNSSTGALSQAFGSNNTAGSAIVAIVYGMTSGTTTVSDSLANTYTFIGTTGGYPARLDVFVALHVAAGANTITTTAGGGILGMEYSSTSSTYYVCVATDLSIPNNGTFVSNLFASTNEVMAVWGSVYNGTLTSWTAATGTVRFAATMPFNFTTSVGGGDDDVSNMATAYSNTIHVNGVTAGSENVIGVFLNLDNPSCLGASRSSVFKILF
jgi:hypothetical protein